MPKRRRLRHETSKDDTKKTQDYRLKFQLDRLQSSIKPNKHHFFAVFSSIFGRSSMKDFNPEKNLSNSTEVTGAKVKMPISEGCVISWPLVIFITFNMPFFEEQIGIFAEKLRQTYFGYLQVN